MAYINYSVNKDVFIKVIFLMFSLVSSFLFSFYGNELWGGIIGLTILLIAALILSGLDLLHPYTWFTPIFYLYSVSVPLLVATGEVGYMTSIKETLFAEWIALTTFLVVVSPMRKKIVINDHKNLENLQLVLKGVYITSVLITFAGLVYVYALGITSKYELALNDSVFLKISGPFYSLFILSFLLLLAHSLTIKKRIPWKLIAFTLGYTFLAILIMGQRDTFLWALMGLVYLYHTLYKFISRKKMIIIGLATLFSIPLLADMRNIGVSNSYQTAYNKDSIIMRITNAEFGAASRNLQIVIDNDHIWSYFYGKTILDEFNLAFFKGTESAGIWFNQTFFPELYQIGGGNGFTIVGEGYINFGLFGVILMFIFLGLLMKYLYVKATKQVIWLVIYTMFIPIMLFMIRGDLASLFAKFSKHIILPLIIIYLTKHILENKHKHKESER